MIDQTNPEHQITVTVGPIGEAVGRAWTDCSCGASWVSATKRAANRRGLMHHHEVNGGCNCPSVLRAHPSHPDPTPATAERTPA